VILTVIQAFYLNVAVWEWIGGLCESMAQSTGYEWLASDSARAAATSIISSILGKLLHLPFSLYSTFVIEAKHNFNQTTYALFFSDLVKETLVYIVFMVPILTVFLKVIEWGGQFFYICS
jgi:STE24 endopeptidase